MGLFKGKKEESSYSSGMPELPKLPELPEIPGKVESGKKHNSLPRFPSNSLADKFSQNTIKDAIAGEGDDKDAIDEFEDEINDESMAKLPQRPMHGEMSPISDDEDEELDIPQYQKPKTFEQTLSRTPRGRTSDQKEPRYSPIVNTPNQAFDSGRK